MEVNSRGKNPTFFKIFEAQNLSQHVLREVDISFLGWGGGSYNARWWFQIFFYVHPESWGDDPTGRAYFPTGWLNHQDRMIHSGRLTWNLQITHLERKNHLPNLHDYVP